MRRTLFAWGLSAWVGCALLLGCSSSVEPEAETAEPALDDAAHNVQVMVATKLAIDTWLADMVVLLQALEDAVPEPDADGWNAVDDPEAVAEMRKRWLDARRVFQRLDFQFRIVFPDTEELVVGVYDVATAQVDDENPFDDVGFIGFHAIERILWSNEIPPQVTEFEQTLRHYRAARFPQNETEAREFKEKLVGGLTGQFRSKADIFEKMAMESILTLETLTTTLFKQHQKVSDRAPSYFEPLYILTARYADVILLDMRESIIGAWEIFQPFRPWVEIQEGGPELLAQLDAAWARTLAIFEAIDGDKLPPIPDDWDPRNPDPGVKDTAWGLLFYDYGYEMNPNFPDSLRALLNETVGILGGHLYHSHTEPTGPLEGLTIAHVHPGFSPIPGVLHAWEERWNEGHDLSELKFFEVDGLGPAYIDNDCVDCHFDVSAGTRGVVKKMVLIDDKGLALEDQSALAYGHTVREEGLAPVRAPEMANLAISQRAAPTFYGRGYMEAVSDEEMLRVEAEQAERTDGISGRVNWVVYTAEPNPTSPFHSLQTGDVVIGRFGLKSQSPTIDDFNSIAYQVDMGLTNPLRPEELPNPLGMTDDEVPGVDVDLRTLNLVSDFVRLTRIPSRGNFPVTYRPRRSLRRTEPPHGNPDQLDPAGRALFDEARCSVCHVPTLRTRADYPVALLADYDAPIYSDLLLHDMGAALADGLPQFGASEREWRTAPLIGVETLSSFLHDGRAATVEEAILMHGEPDSEAFDSVERFRNMSDAERRELIRFTEGL